MCRLNGLLPPLEVDEYTTAPKLFASKWAIKKKRRIYNEKKAVLSGRLGDFNTGLETVCVCQHLGGLPFTKWWNPRGVSKVV